MKGSQFYFLWGCQHNTPRDLKFPLDFILTFDKSFCWSHLYWGTKLKQTNGFFAILYKKKPSYFQFGFSPLIQHNLSLWYWYWFFILTFTFIHSLPPRPLWQSHTWTGWAFIPFRVRDKSLRELVILTLSGPVQWWELPETVRARHFHDSVRHIKVTSRD